MESGFVTAPEPEFIAPELVIAPEPEFVAPGPAVASEAKFVDPDLVIEPDTESEFDETEPSRKKRIQMFPTTRGDHIRFIIVIVAILLFEMLFIGFLTSKGVLEIGIFQW
jgi:hypothetical protein